MNYATVCSGAEAFGPAWHELGFRPVFHAEIEAHASAVLRYQYPTVPNYGDFTQIATPDGPAPARPVQLLCGGTPCQTYSVAGLRAGLNSYKGGLTLEFVRLAQRLNAKWLLWENVPGVLSSDGGRAFGTFLGTLAECGYGFAYRILDLQHFGCPQRRKRVFLVAHSGGDWQSCAQVLFERESLRGNPAPSREAGQEVTGTLSSRATAGGGLGTDFDCAGGLIAGQKVWNVAFNDINGSRPDRPLGGLYVNEVDTHKTLHAGAPGETIVQSFTEYAGNAEGATGLPFLTVSKIGKMVNNQTPLLTVTAFSAKNYGADATVELSPTLLAGGSDKSHANSGNWMAIMQPAGMAFQQNSRAELRYIQGDGRVAGALSADAGMHQQNFIHATPPAAVRRLTPVECERLMGWADDWTKYGINAKGKQYELADGPRYRICGNGWGQPVVSWIAARILEIEALTNTNNPTL